MNPPGASPTPCPQDVTGNSLFEGGFLGMDNVSPFDRSTMNGMHGARLEQAVRARVCVVDA